jgi:hypothetical protein
MVLDVEIRLVSIQSQFFIVERHRMASINDGLHHLFDAQAITVLVLDESGLEPFDQVIERLDPDRLIDVKAETPASARLADVNALLVRVSSTAVRTGRVLFYPVIVRSHVLSSKRRRPWRLVLPSERRHVVVEVVDRVGRRWRWSRARLAITLT